MSERKRAPLSPLAKAALDFGPLIAFFAAYSAYDIYVATAVFMAGVFVALGVVYALERRLAPMPLFMAPLVLVFGGLTLWLQDETFIKLKPTVLYAFFGALLLGGLAFDRIFLKHVFSHVFRLPEAAWRALTWRWGVFAFALALANEIVWRSFSTDVWVAFKVWGFMSAIFAFSLAQTPFILKYQIEDEGKPKT